MKPICAAIVWLVAGSAVWADQAEQTDRPLLAVWRQDDGNTVASEAPYLRFAIWSDGRVLFADDPMKWGHELRRTNLSQNHIARLKTALSLTGIFELQRTSYLVPCAPRDCLLVDLDGRQQLLFWDERELPGYGINIAPKPRDLEFKRCWKLVNHLGLVALPDEGDVVQERIQIPKSWSLKQPDSALAQTKAPEPDATELAKAVTAATDKLNATVTSPADYKLTKAELAWVREKYVWLVTYRPFKLLPEDPSTGPIGVGGEVFISVDPATGQSEVRYGE